MVLNVSIRTALTFNIRVRIYSINCYLIVGKNIKLHSQYFTCSRTGFLGQVLLILGKPILMVLKFPKKPDQWTDRRSKNRLSTQIVKLLFVKEAAIQCVV